MFREIERLQGRESAPAYLSDIFGVRRGGPTAEAAGRDWRGQYAAVTPASVSPLVAARRARAPPSLGVAASDDRGAAGASRPRRGPVRPPRGAPGAGGEGNRSHLPKIKTMPVYIG